MRFFYLIGTGRSPETRAIRRDHRFPAKAFRIGDSGILIRPGLRVAVALHTIQKQAKEIARYEELGTLRILSDRGAKMELKDILGESVMAGLDEMLDETPPQEPEAAEEPSETPTEPPESPEAQEEPEEALEDEMGESGPEDEPEAPEEAPEAEEAPEDEEEASALLPEGWQSFVKRDLLALFDQLQEEYGEDAPALPEDTRNETLIKTLEMWEEAYS